jgi:hypothetical protein
MTTLNIIADREHEIIKHIELGFKLHEIAQMFDCGHSQVNKIFFSSNTWNRLVERLKTKCVMYGKNQYSDDVVNSYALHLIEGKAKSQTLDQFFIDFGRKMKWCFHSNDKLAEDKKMFYSPLEFIDHQDIFSVCDSESLDDKISKYKDIKSLKPSYAIMLRLKVKLGLTYPEIAEITGTTKENIAMMFWNLKNNHRYSKKNFTVSIDEDKFKSEISAINKKHKLTLLELNNTISELSNLISGMVKEKPTTLFEIEKNEILLSIKRNRTQISAAKELGISERTIRNKLKLYRNLEVL